MLTDRENETETEGEVTTTTDVATHPEANAAALVARYMASPEYEAVRHRSEASEVLDDYAGEHMRGMSLEAYLVLSAYGRARAKHGLPVEVYVLDALRDALRKYMPTTAIVVDSDDEELVDPVGAVEGAGS